MPIDLLKTIVETFDKIQADADFDDWNSTALIGALPLRGSARSKNRSEN
jgi:hypothetical protein